MDIVYRSAVVELHSFFFVAKRDKLPTKPIIASMCDYYTIKLYEHSRDVFRFAQKGKCRSLMAGKGNNRICCAIIIP